MKKGFLICFGLVYVASAPAQLVFSGAPLSDSLDALPTAPAFTFLDNWVDNSTALGWYRTLISDGTPGVENRFRVDDGTATGGSLWSLGQFSSTDRALGMTPSSNLPTMFFGVRILNASGSTLSSIAIDYVGEQWRQGADGFDSLRFSYQVGATDLQSGTWTEVPAMSFDAVHQSGTIQARNGNLPENQQAISGTLSNLQWAAGDSLWIRWKALDRPGANHTLAVDNLRIQAVPEPASWTVLGLGAAAILRRLRQPRATPNT